MRIEVLAPGSAEYAGAIALRRRVLRWPLGLEFTEAELAEEQATGTLLGAMGETGEVLGTALLSPWEGGQTIQIRQVAVEERARGQGIARALMGEAERTARARGARAVVLHARADVVAFYARLGYARQGEPFTELGIPHQTMGKSLAPAQP